MSTGDAARGEARTDQSVKDERSLGERSEDLIQEDYTQTHMGKCLHVCRPEAERFAVERLQVVPVRRVDELARSSLGRPLHA